MVEEITIQELAQMEPSACQIIDMRDETAFALGHIDGAVLIPQKELETSHGELPRDKMLVIYCRSGILSADVAEQLRDEGYQAVNLVGGYVQWLQDKIRRETKNEKAAEVEQGLRKKFHRVIFSRFAKAIKTYDLIQPNDRIAVCISGGKDSMLMAKLFQELQRHGKFPFELVFLVMDPGYSAENRQIIESNAKLLQIPITVFETNIFDSVYNVQNNPCYLCARMRRGFLYSKAQELGCNKIALGHHLSDVLETTLLGLFYGAQLQTMPPKLRSRNFPGMELIRPLYCVHEDAIIAWKNYNGLRFLQCACRFTEERDGAADGVGESKRQEMKLLLRELKKTNPNIEKSMFRAIHGVQLDTFPGFKFRGRAFAFPEAYNLRGASSAEDEAAL